MVIDGGIGYREIERDKGTEIEIERDGEARRDRETR